MEHKLEYSFNCRFCNNELRFFIIKNKFIFNYCEINCYYCSNTEEYNIFYSFRVGLESYDLIYIGICNKLSKDIDFTIDYSKINGKAMCCGYEVSYNNQTYLLDKENNDDKLKPIDYWNIRKKFIKNLNIK